MDDHRDTIDEPQITDRPAGRGGPAGGVDEPDPFDEFERIGWSGAAAEYERFFGPITARLIEPVLERAGVGVGTRMVDVACGPGNLVAAAVARGAVAAGVDVADSMVALARGAHPGLDVRRASALQLPFGPGEIDVAVAAFALMHVAAPHRVVGEMARVLRPGGRVAITVWDAPERCRLFGWVLEALAAAGASPPADIPAGPPFFQFADDGALRSVLIANGLDEPEIDTVTFTHPAASTDAIWSGIVGGSVRTSALIRRQPPRTRHRIRAAFDELAASAAVADGIAIPFSVKLAVATR